MGASDGALAMGLENGDVWLYTCARDGTWQLHTTLARHHTGPVHRVACRPQGRWMDAYDRVPYQLFSVGDDGCTRLVSWYIDPWRPYFCGTHSRLSNGQTGRVLSQ